MWPGLYSIKAGEEKLLDKRDKKQILTSLINVILLWKGFVRFLFYGLEAT